MKVPATAIEFVRRGLDRLTDGGASAAPEGDNHIEAAILGAVDEISVSGGPHSTKIDIRGWALLDGRPAGAALVRANGRIVGAFATGRERSDVADALGSGDVRACGFAGIVDLLPLLVAGAVSTIELRLEVLDQAGIGRGLLATTELVIELPREHGGITGGIDVSSIPAPIRQPRFSVSGWAAIAGRPAATITLWVDDVPVGVATTGLERPDLAAATGSPAISSAGFACVVDVLPALAPGTELLLRASVADVNGTVQGWLDAVPLDYGGPRSLVSSMGGIDHWQDGDRVERDLVRVYGWAAIPGARAAGVVISVNGRPASVAPLGIARPDLEKHLSRQEFDGAGFDTQIDLSDVEGDEAVVEASVIPAGLANVLLDVDATVLSSVTLRLPKVSRSRSVSRVRGGLDVPLDRGVERGVVNLWGWALGLEEPVDGVELLVEGESRGFARFGLDRLDIAKRYDQAHAGACGFEHLVDFSTLSDAVRRVRISVVGHLLGGDSVEISAKSARLLDRPKPPTRKNEDRAETLRSRTRALVSSLPVPVDEELRLLAVTHHLGYGGAQLWLSELLARSGAGHKYQCTVLSPQDGDLRPDLERMGVSVHVTNGFPMQSAELYEARIAELAVLARAQRWNAVLVNTALCSMGADLALRLDLPCVWAIHESWPPAEFWAVAYPPRHIDPIVLRSANRLFGEVDALVFEAEATRQQYLGHASAEHTHVVHYGIDTRAVDRYLAKVSREQARETLGFKDDDLVILVVGTVEPRKAQTIIAEAFSAVSAEHPKARLIFVGGGDTPYSEALRLYVDGTELGDRIEIHPIVRDTYLRYRAADLFLSASDVESLPRSVLEVMYFGVPVLATEVFGLPELIDHGKTGFLFAAKSLGAAIEALSNTLSLPASQLRRVGQAGRELVGRSYDSLGYSTEIVGMIRSLLRP
jgi:D-inositol-3-phosphate glycosyltransferase